MHISIEDSSSFIARTNKSTFKRLCHILSKNVPSGAKRSAFLHIYFRPTLHSTRLIFNVTVIHTEVLKSHKNNTCTFSVEFSELCVLAC